MKIVIGSIGLLIGAGIGLFGLFFGALFGTLALVRKRNHIEEAIQVRERQGVEANRWQLFAYRVLQLVIYISPFKGIPGMRVDRENQSIVFVPNQNIEPDSFEWFEWLSRFYNRHFYVYELSIYDDVELFSAYRTRSGVWQAVFDISGKRYSFKLGSSCQVTEAKIFEVIDEHDRLWKEYLDTNNLN